MSSGRAFLFGTPVAERWTIGRGHSLPLCVPSDASGQIQNGSQGDHVLIISPDRAWETVVTAAAWLPSDKTPRDSFPCGAAPPWRAEFGSAKSSRFEYLTARLSDREGRVSDLQS